MKKAKGQKPVTLDPDEQLKRLGERIKQLRISAGHSSYEYFAYTHEISRTQYLRYEQGKDIRFSTLVKLVSAFNMTLEEFFSEGFG